MEALRGPQECVRAHAFRVRRAPQGDRARAEHDPGLPLRVAEGRVLRLRQHVGTGIASREMERRCLQEARVSCSSGTSFGALGKGFVRFSYASSEETIVEACKRVRELLARELATK
jgi:bifunctional pyridoxal-dependent enzyme with beta-cystathionase and maltose regulon repressor activities